MTAGERSGPLAGVEAQLLDAMVGHLVIPTRIEIGTQTEVLVHSEPGVGGCVLGHEPDPSELRRSVGRTTTEHLNRTGGRSEETDAQMQQGGLPCTVRSDQPDDLPFGDGQSAVGEGPAPSVPLAEAGSLQYGGHATPSAKQLRNAVR